MSVISSYKFSLKHKPISFHCRVLTMLNYMWAMRNRLRIFIKQHLVFSHLHMQARKQVFVTSELCYPAEQTDFCINNAFAQVIQWQIIFTNMEMA